MFAFQNSLISKMYWQHVERDFHVMPHTVYFHMSTHLLYLIMFTEAA